MTQAKQKIGRGPSPASKAAEKHFAKHPDATAKELATKFKLSLPAIYRSKWWIAAKGEK